MASPSRKKTTASIPPPKGAFSLRIKNFGPIIDGTIDVRNLTVLIGPNMSGKSYAAMIINAIMRAGYMNLGSTMRLENIWLVFQQLAKVSKGEIVDLSDHGLVEDFKGIVMEEFLADLNFELEESFSNLLQLHRSSGDAIELRLATKQLRLSLSSEGGVLEIHGVSFEKQKVGLKKRGEHEATLLFDNEAVATIDSDTKDEMATSFSLLPNIWLSGLRARSHYLPAGRTSIMQTYRDIASTAVKQPLRGTSGVMKNFIAELMQLPPKETGPFYNLAVELEQEILKGDLSFAARERLLLPEIIYRSGGYQIPLHLASSTINELAPIILYLKYLVEPGTTLIIEEPEAHLHPQNQVLLAKYLVKLVRAGVRVIVTTHSDYLLEQLGGYLMLSGLGREARRKVKAGKDDYIQPDELGVYAFVPRGRSGFVIEPVEVDAQTGISSEGYLQVQELLYNRSAQIRTLAREKS